MPPFSIRLALAIAAVLLLAIACGGNGNSSPELTRTPVPTAAPTAADALCAGTKEVAGNVASPDLVEISGLAASRENEGVLWAHNDSGDSARVFAIGAHGEDLGTFTLAGAEAIDWEDMAIGPGPEAGADYLYLGDIGDNDKKRPEIVIYRVREPQVSSQGTPSITDLTGVETLTTHYPAGAHDAETLLIDPDSGDIYVVTKELLGGPAEVYRASLSLATDGTNALEKVGEIDFPSLQSKVAIAPDSPPLVRGVPNLPAGGDVSPDGSLIAIRTYGSVWLWDRPEGASIAQAFIQRPCEAPSNQETQGEAIAFDADSRGYTTTSEGANPPLTHVVAQ